MTKIALTVAAVILSAGAAFAGSDHYGSENVNRLPAPVAANIDYSFTASIPKPVNHNNAGSATGNFQSEPGQGIWGR